MNFSKPLLTLLALLFLTGVSEDALAKAAPPDAFCQCVKSDGSFHFYNLRTNRPVGCKAYIFHSSSDDRLSGLSGKQRKKVCKTGKLPKSISSTSWREYKSKHGNKGENTSSQSTANKPKKKKKSDPYTASPKNRPKETNGIPASPYNELIAKASADFDIPVALIHAVIRVESNYKPQAKSSAGAMGLMQLMPQTAQSLGVQSPYDPAQNIRGGTAYLRKLADQFEGDIVKTLAAYHAGPGVVTRTDGIPYEKTERYVKKVLGHYYRMKSD